MDGRKGGLSAKTIQNQHMLLKDFFAYAMRKYHLPCNPTVDTTRPEVITPEMRVLSPSEMQIFIDAAVIIGLKTIRLKKSQKHGAF